MTAEKTPIVEYACTQGAFTPFQTRWIPGSASLILAGENPKGDGIFEVHRVEKDGLQKLSEVKLGAGVKCCTFSSCISANQIVFGTFKGDVSVLDLQTQGVAWTGEQSHSSVVNTIDGCGGIGGGSGAREVSSVSRDGRAKVWDVRQKSSVLNLEPTSPGIECWSVAFGNAHSSTDRNLVVGYANGDIKMLDLRTMTITWETNVRAGVCHISFDRKDIQMNKLYVSTLGGKVHAFDLRTFNTQSGFTGLVEQVCKSTVWGCYPLPQDRELSMVTTGDGSLNMYRYEYPAVRSEVDDSGAARGVAGTLKCIATSENISTQPIVSFDWSHEKRGLFALTSFDQALRVGLVLGAN